MRKRTLDVDAAEHPATRRRPSASSPSAASAAAAAAASVSPRSSSGWKAGEGMLSALPRDIMQMLAADMWQVHDFFRVVATCRRLHTIYSSEELVFRKFSQSGIILCAGGPDVDQPAGDQMEQGATSTPDTDAASVDRPSTIIGHGIGHSTACPSEYAYLLPSIGPNASSPRARLALPRSTMLPRLSSPCTWKLLLRSLFTLARLPRLPITSLLHPASKEGVRSAAIVASTRDRKEQDIDKLLRLSDGPHNMLMWSSTGSPQRHRADAVEEDGRPIDDWLLFRSYTHPLSFLTRVRIKIFQCYYQPREPIFHPSYIRFKVGHDARKWEYTSPWYRCEEHAQCQDFYFYDPAQYHSPERHGPMMLISGSYLRVEFSEYNTKQLADDQYYCVLSSVELEGLPLERLVSVMEEEGTSEKELAAVVGVMMNSAAEVDLRQANVEALSPPEVVTPESFSGTTADSGLASTSPRPSLSHSEILHRYTSFRSLPLTLQSLRDHSSTRELLGEFADLLRRAQWERLGARVANESGMEGMGQEGEEEEEEEEEGGEDDEEEHEEKDSDGEDAAPHPAASAQAQQPDVDMAESGVVTAPTADTILSSYTVVTRPQMSTRFRNLLLECVIHRSLEITRALRTTQRQVHNADLPSAARLSRGHTLAIASYVRGFLSQSIRLTEFESLVVCHLEREVKGIMQTAWVHGGITGSKRIGDLLFERQQYLLALRVYSFARIDGCALTTMCALPSHFERLVLHLQYLAEAFEFSYEDALKRIVQLNGGPATPSSLAASPGGLIPSHLSNPLKFASLLVGPGYARMEPERIVAILGLEQHLQPDDTLHTQIQHLRTTLAQPPGSANAGEQLIDPID